MTEVQFHTGLAEPLQHALRLLRKVEAQGRRVAVLGPGEWLLRLDQRLWTDDPQDFRPHLRLAAGEQAEGWLAPTPVWLVEQLDSVPADVDTLLHWAGEDPHPPAGFERFAKLVDLVGADPASRQAGRQRWRHYADRGHPLRHHALEA